MKHLFFSNQVTNNFLQLDEEESAHAQRVLRLKKGDSIWVTNGSGTLYACEITETAKKSVTAIIQSSTQHQRNVTGIHLAIAPTKNMDRLEWLVEKLVETGITGIHPVLCNHAERKVLKTERLHKIALMAMKQSQQYWLPEIHELTEYNSFLKSMNELKTEKLIAHCRKPGLPHIKNFIRAENPDYYILIGPEGDFSEAEINLALAAGWKEISLGETRLRTETAGLIACTAIHILTR